MTRLPFRRALAVATIGLMSVAAAIAARTDKKTDLTVHEAIEVPGAVLEPGKYSIEVLPNQGSNHTVLFRDEEGEPISVALAIPAQRNEVMGNTKFTFYESPGGQPPALRSWFYPGDAVGQEFAYPESRGKEISAFARRHVPTVSDDMYKSMHSHGKDGPDPMVVQKLTIYTIDPGGKKSDVETGRAWNEHADRMASRPEEFVSSAEIEETRMERQIRKEVVTLPFYSLWDHITYRISDDGEVELMGKVYRPSMKKSVERVVKNVEGVKSVQNNIEILPTSTLDDDIRRTAFRAIYGHPALQNYQMRAVPPIHIIVANGEITLEGV